MEKSSEKAIYEIRHQLNDEVLFEHYYLGARLKKRILALRIIACWFIGIAVACFTDDSPILGCFCSAFAVLLLVYPYRIRRCVRKFYAKDETIYGERVLRLYDDHLELETPVGITKCEYAKLKKTIEGKLGIYLYVSGLIAVCIPKDILTQESLNFLRNKTKK